MGSGVEDKKSREKGVMHQAVPRREEYLYM